jgi:phage shock protein A
MISIRSSLSRILMPLIPETVWDAIDTSVASVIRDGRAREDALERTLERMLRDLAKARQDLAQALADVADEKAQVRHRDEQAGVVAGYLRDATARAEKEATGPRPTKVKQ